MCDAEPKFIGKATPMNELFETIDELKKSVDSLISKYVKAIDALNDLRKIHKPRKNGINKGSFCRECSTEWTVVDYPCKTIKTIDGEQS
jgi:hypothetical protein